MNFSFATLFIIGNSVYDSKKKVTCFAEAGGQHVSGMARAVQELGIRACLAESIMDAGQGLPKAWANRTTEQCIQVK